MTTACATTDPYIAALRAGDLFADPAYQRDLEATRVERMSSELDRTLLGVLEVSARDDARYAIIDGQHRWAVVRFAGGGDAHLVCQVHTGLSIEDEARLFYEIDTGRKTLSWWEPAASPPRPSTTSASHRAASPARSAPAPPAPTAAWPSSCAAASASATSSPVGRRALTESRTSS